MSNDTQFDPELCTLDTCSVEEYGQIRYIPTLPGNATYLGIFVVLFVAQSYLGIRHRTWGYLVGMLAGIALELLGYAGRIMLYDNIFNNNNFIIYLIGLTIGPAFLTAAIYLCLGRIITIYSVRLSILKPKWVTIIFVGCDLVSLILQAAGGAITSLADDQEQSQMGINIMIAGLASQVASIVLFMAIGAHFAWRVFQNPLKLEAEFATLRSSRRFIGMLCGKFSSHPVDNFHVTEETNSCFLAIVISVTTILIRSIFRLIELQEGFNGELANNELDFMILEGPMIFIAVALLTVWHPGWILGEKLWVDAGFRLRPTKKQENDKRAFASIDASESESRMNMEMA